MNTDLSAVAGIILDSVYDQLACTSFGVPCLKFVSLCPPVMPCCDYVAVWVESLAPTGWLDACNILEPSEVLFNVKLVRPCGVDSGCATAEDNQAKVFSLMDDSLYLRSGLMRSGPLVDSFLVSSQNQHNVEYMLSSVNYDCDESEQCSVITGGITFRIKLCVDACQIESVPDATRCDCVIDPEVVVPTVISDSYGI